MRPSRVFRHVLTLAVLPSVSAGQGVSATRMELNRAASYLSRGLADSALASYRQALVWAQAGQVDSAVIAEAYFGMATTKGSILKFSAEQSRIDEYLRAAALDPARFFVAATNNAAQLKRQQGDHATSARLFSAAAREPHPARSYIFLDAGREWLNADRPDSALAFFERAVREDPNNTAAVDAFVAPALSRGDDRRILSLPESTKDADPSTQQIVARALVELMADAATRRPEFDSALAGLAPVLIRVGAGPEFFALSLRPRLAEAALRQQHVGARSLIAAYERPPSETLIPAWWDENTERRRLWTGTMTALGTRHAERGDLQIARRYYECALGYPYAQITAPWVDVEALVPLGRIYADLERAESDRFVRWAFDEKMIMYELLRHDAPRAIPIIRRLHWTLGLIFARRGQWGSSAYDFQGAAFQLAHMRDMTRRMRADGAPVSDPPELLEELVYAYWAVGSQSEARALIPEVLGSYRERNQVREAERFERVAVDPTLLEEVIRRRR